MKLHLPISLRQSLLACLALSVGCTLSEVSTAVASDSVLDAEGTLSIGYAEAETILDLSGEILQQLLYGCGAGDGRVYTLATGISELHDAEGNPMVLDDSNNAATLYFDTNQPGIGFWADATLQLTSDGSLQLLRHNETVKEELTVSTRKTSDANYQYYEGVCFKDISSTSDGGAICGDNIALSDNGYASFSENTAGGSYVSSARGGAICGDNIDLSGNGFVGFTDNTAAVVTDELGNLDVYGGAIYGDSITLSDNREVSFQGNVACGQFIPSPILLDSFLASYDDVYNTCITSCGGAICGGTIKLMNNERVYFNGNAVDGSHANGGAIFVGERSTVALHDNGSVTFSGNTASSSFSDFRAYGGAIYGSVTMKGNGDVSFSGNTASSSSSSYYSANAYAYGGAIYGNTIELSGNESVEFSGNTASSSSANSATFSYANDCAYGGAIYGYAGDIVLSNNGRVRFEANEARSNYGSAYGGAIYRDWGAGDHSVILHNNRSVEFLGNKASSNLGYAYGGAIYGESASTIALSNNGKVTFSGNTADYGGAIYGDDGSTIVLSNNDSVTFSGNKASCGGAIYVSGNLSIRNNESVLFEQNAEITDGIYRLRSIVGGGNVDVVSLSAAAGKSIEFRDSVYITSGSTVNLNEDYTYLDEEGVSVTVEQKGDIVFTGATTVDDLYTVKGNVAGTAEEILASRTTEVKTVANLYNGRLIIKEGAIWSGDGITVASAEGASYKPTLLMQNGHLSHYEPSDAARNVVTIKSGATLEVAGKNTASYTSLILEGGSALTFNLSAANTSADTAVLCMSDSSLTLPQGGTLTLKLVAFDGITDSQSYALLTGVNQPSNWNSANITVASGTDGWDVSMADLRWDGTTLWLCPELVTATWTNESRDGKWNTTSLNWEQNEVDYEYRDGLAVVFGDTGAGTVTLVGNIAPKSVLVNSTKDYIWVADDTVGGKLTGSMKLTKQGEGTLTINTSNDYTGGTEIKGGTVLAGTATALGTGAVVLNGGTLEIGATGLDNSICNTGTSTLQTSDRITHVLTGTISNTGTLTLSGSFDASALDYETKGSDDRYALDGSVVGSDKSGFAVGVTHQVKVVDGGTSINDIATILHDSHAGSNALVLESDGYARANGDGHYSHYFLTNGDAVSVGEIAQVATGKNGILTNVNMDSGSLTVDQSITVDADGGSIIISKESELSGTIDDTAVSTGAGNYTGTISAVLGGSSSLAVGGGNITVSGANSYTGGTTVNGGTLMTGNAQAFGTGDVVVNGATLDLKQFSIANKVVMNGRSTLGYADGASHIVLGSGAAVNFRNGYTLGSGKSLTVAGPASYTGALTLGGGTLELDGLLTVRGDVEFVNGATTTLDISGWKGLGDGDVLVDFGSSNSGYADGSLSLEGIAGDWELSFDAATGVLTLLAVKDEPEIPDTPEEPEIPDTPVEPEKPAPVKLVWAGEKKAVWKVGAPGWENQKSFNNGAEVSFVNGGTVTIEGKVAPGAISVNNHKNLTFKSKKKTPGSISGEGDLTKRGAGTLTLNDGNSSWTGDTHLYAGIIKVKGATSLGKGDVYLKGGTLNLGSKAIANDIIQSRNATIKSGKKFTGNYTLEKGELQKGSTLNITKTATLEGGTVNGTLSGNGTVTVTGEVKLGDKGKIKTSALTLGDGAELSTSVKGLNSKSTSLCIEEDASLVLSGKLTAASLEVDGGTLKTYASKPVAISVQKDMTLTDAVLATSGKVTANKLTLNASSMSIKGAKAQSLTVKQSLTIGNGSNLSLNGKLSTGSLTLKSGATLTMSGSKPVTLKVKGALTLNSGSSIILDYDFVQGKTYKILTFGSLSGVSGVKDLHDVFGVDNENCVFENTGKAITLTVTGKWNPQTQQKAVSAATSEGVVITSAPKSAGNPVADALVQSNWGQLEASRAFVNAMANRSMAVQLGNGERAVWASAIGSSSRHSSAGDHAGADTNVSGGAFGLETQVGRASLFGMALGNSWTRVSAHGFGTIEQDTTHLGLYGQTNWRSGVTADWSAAYGRSDSETMGSDWNQKHLQLDGRMSYNHELNASTVLSPFACLQYYASDSATVDGTSTGSLQNLRAEIGVAASRRMGKFGIYGEIAVHQDMARSNPTVSMEGARYTGMNPGRTGLNLTVGASYALTDKWSMNASYTGEVVENANAHSANIGATYKF